MSRLSFSRTARPSPAKPKTGARRSRREISSSTTARLPCWNLDHERLKSQRGFIAAPMLSCSITDNPPHDNVPVSTRVNSPSTYRQQQRSRPRTARGRGADDSSRPRGDRSDEHGSGRAEAGWQSVRCSPRRQPSARSCPRSASSAGDANAIELGKATTVHQGTAGAARGRRDTWTTQTSTKPASDVVTILDAASDGTKRRARVGPAKISGRNQMMDAITPNDAEGPARSTGRLPRPASTANSWWRRAARRAV